MYKVLIFGDSYARKGSFLAKVRYFRFAYQHYILIAIIIMIVLAQSVPGTSDKEEESGLTREEIQEQERLR